MRRWLICACVVAASVALIWAAIVASGAGRRSGVCGWQRLGARVLEHPSETERREIQDAWDRASPDSTLQFHMAQLEHAVSALRRDVCSIEEVRRLREGCYIALGSIYKDPLGGESFYVIFGTVTPPYQPVYVPVVYY